MLVSPTYPGRSWVLHGYWPHRTTIMPDIFRAICHRCAGRTRSVYPVRASDSRTGLLAAWSSDDRWLAYVDAAPTGLLIAEAGKDRAYPFAADGNYLAWRPQP